MEQPPLSTHWYTDRGRRPANEDAVLVEPLFGDRDLVAVADGMGGHAGGEVASGKALETLLSCLESSNDLVGAVREANAALQQASEANPEWRGMGTTLVALLRVGETYHVANVGDSRAYRIDAQGIGRITEDHSFTAEAVSSGRLSEDEAQRSPWRNALTRAVGTDAEVEVDVFGPFALEPPHVVVLCTDGLYRVMSDEELGTEVLSGRDRSDNARDLVANALRRGSSDNISVVLVEFGDLTDLEATEVRSTAAAVRAAAPALEPAAPPQTAEVVAQEGPEAVPIEGGESPVEEPVRAAPSAEEPAADPAVPSAGETAPAPAASPDEQPASAPAAPPTRDEGAGSVVSDEPAASPRAEPTRSVPSPASVEGSGTPESPVRTEPADRAERLEASDRGDTAEPPITAAEVTSSYRKAKPAQPRRRRPPRPPRKLPSWVKREAIPAAILVLGTLAIVYVLTSVFG